MPMEDWVKCLSPQNTFGVSGVNSIAAKSNKIEVTGDHFFKLKKKQKKKTTTCLHTARVVSSKCSETPTFTFDSKRHLEMSSDIVLWSHVHVSTHTQALAQGHVQGAWGAW